MRFYDVLKKQKFSDIQNRTEEPNRKIQSFRFMSVPKDNTKIR